jgi:RNA methyltransferase, TrmH family
MMISKQNKNFKLWKSLMLKKYRDVHGLFLIYGSHQIEKAKQAQAIQEIITSDPNLEGTLIDSSLMDELQQAETNFNQIAVCKKINPIQISNKILMLDDVQDPDNVGALIRSASAFGFMHIILSNRSADLYNEKTIRASKGSIFDVYVERRPLELAIKELKEKNYTIVYADAHEQGQIHQKDQVVLILGNEGHGVSKEIKMLADASLTIPTKHVESLNVSVAGGILMYEWRDI